MLESVLTLSPTAVISLIIRFADIYPGAAFPPNITDLGRNFAFRYSGAVFNMER